jgi:hypothetical protein
LGKGNINRIDKEAKDLKLVSIWLGRDNQWVHSSEITEEVANMDGFSKPTINRYLDTLVKKNILERPLGEDKEELQDNERNRWFRPTKEYWDQNFQWIPIGPKANDSEYLLLSAFVSKVSARFVEISQHAIKEAPKPSVVTRFSSRKRRALNSKITALLSATRLDIARTARNYYKQGMSKEAKYANLRNSLMKVTDAYLDLWDYVMTTNGALDEFADRMEKLQKAVKQIR